MTKHGLGLYSITIVISLITYPIFNFQYIQILFVDCASRGAIFLRGITDRREIVHQNCSIKQVPHTIWKVSINYNDINKSCSLDYVYWMGSL